MSKTDTKGKPWARLSKLKAGDYVKADGGFTCLHDGAIHKVHRDKEGLFIFCSEDKHYLDGQADDGEHLVGLYPA